MTERLLAWLRRHGLSLGVWALHLSLLGQLLPLSLFIHDVPVSGFDFALHLYQFQRAAQSFSEVGQLWSYDPLFLAGQPAGVLEDLTSKGSELWIIAGARVGLSLARSLYLLLLVTHLLVPVLGWASARLFGLSPPQARLAMALWVLLWWFDSALHIAWWIGMFSWAGAALLVVFVVALVHHGVESGRRWPWWLLILVAPTLALHHPFGAITAAPACAVLLARRWRRLRAVDALLLAVAGLAAASTALVWLRPYLAYRHLMLDIPAIGSPSLVYVVYDSLDTFKDYLRTGFPVRTVYRTVGWVAAAILLRRWWRVRDPRVAPLALLIGVGVGFAYLGGYSHALQQTQPYRQIMPAMLAAALPTAVLLQEIASPAALRALPGNAKVLLSLAAVAVVPRLYFTAATYLPQLSPTPVVSHAQDIMTPMIGPMTHLTPSPDWYRVRELLQRLHGEQARGRVLVAEWPLMEWLASSTALPLLGGHIDRPVPQIDANLFSIDRRDQLPPEQLEHYVERFAIGWFVASGRRSALERTALVEPVQSIGAYRVYRLRPEPSYFARGSGVIVEQRMNLLRVEGVEGPEVVLRYHWLDSLRCRPGCQVERAEQAGARAGFLRIRQPPASFEIFNSYELP